MEAEIKQRIEELIGQMKCPKDFTCAKEGFTRLCRAKDIGLDTYLECLEDTPRHCKFALSFGKAYFCECPLRVFVAKQLQR